MEIINLNLIPGKAWPVAHATQFDKGREFRANLFEGSQVYTLAGDETVDAIIKKPDGNQVIETLVNTADNYVIVTTTEQMTAVAGPSLGEIRISKGDTVIGSLKFILECEQSADTGIESHSEINNLETQIGGMVADALATQYDSANVVFDDEPTDGHGIPYTVTSKGIRNAIDNVLDMTDTASGAIATFESEYALPLRNLEIEINAVQESGVPSPSSPKAITGFTGANIHVADNETPHVIDNVTAISWQSEAGTVYGGSLDVTTGVLTVDRASVTLNGSEEWNNKTGLANIFSYSNPSIKNWGGAITAVSNTMADSLTPISQTALVKGTYGISVFAWGNQICVRVENISSAVALKTYLTSNPLQAVYELTTPQTIQLTPTQISAIVGTNNVFTDTNGDTTLEYYTKRGEQTVRIAEGVAVDVVNNKSIDTLTTNDKTLVGAVNELNTNKQDKLSYKEYSAQIGTSLWNGVYYTEINVATDVSNYGAILSAIVIDESEQSDFSSHTNRACFCQVITTNAIRLYSPQASNASGHYVKYRVTFGGNAVNRT